MYIEQMKITIPYHRRTLAPIFKNPVKYHVESFQWIISSVKDKEKIHLLILCMKKNCVELTECYNRTYMTTAYHNDTAGKALMYVYKINVWILYFFSTNFIPFSIYCITRIFNFSVTYIQYINCIRAIFSHFNNFAVLLLCDA